MGMKCAQYRSLAKGKESSVLSTEHAEDVQLHFPLSIPGVYRRRGSNIKLSPATIHSQSQS
jgi:hypothetical protein